MADESQPDGIRRPKGTRTSRVDEKGRLKLPTDIDRYLRATGAVDVFLTSFDGRTARIYSEAEWERVEALLEGPSEHGAQAEILLHRANYYGAEATIDAQGRLLMSPELRREMGVENQPVLMHCTKGHVEVYSEAVHEQKMGRDQNTDELMKPFINLGLR